MDVPATDDAPRFKIYDTCMFLKLPVELRCLIYKLVLPPTFVYCKRENLVRCGLRRRLKSQAESRPRSIFCVNKQVNQEVKDCFTSSCRLQFNGILGFGHFLKLGQTIPTTLRHVELCLQFTRYPHLHRAYFDGGPEIDVLGDAPEAFLRLMKESCAVVDRDYGNFRQLVAGLRLKSFHMCIKASCVMDSCQDDDLRQLTKTMPMLNDSVPVGLMVGGDYMVTLDCPTFTYHWQYIQTVGDLVLRRFDQINTLSSLCSGAYVFFALGQDDSPDDDAVQDHGWFRIEKDATTVEENVERTKFEEDFDCIECNYDDYLPESDHDDSGDLDQELNDGDDLAWFDTSTPTGYDRAEQPCNWIPYYELD